MGWGTFVPAWAGGGVASDLLAFMAEGRRLGQDSWLHPQRPFPVSLGPNPTSLCFPAALRSFPDLWAHVASFPHYRPEPHLPAEPTAQPCPLPCPLLTPWPGLSSGAGKRAGTRQQTEALAFGTKPGSAGWTGSDLRLGKNE